MRLVDWLMPKIAKDQLDRTNLGWTLSPVIGHPHWKPKYNGAIHKLIRGKNPLNHQNKYPKEFLKDIKKAKERYKKNIINLKQSADWVKDFLLDYCCNNELPKGARHFVIEKNLAAFITFRKDRDEIKDKYYKAQSRNTDTLRTWEFAILRGEFTEVYPGELGKFIKDYDLPFNIPKPTIEESPLIMIDNYTKNVEQFYKTQPFFYDKTGIFWFWKDNKYEQMDEIDVMNMLDDILGFEGQTVNSKLKIHYIEGFKRVGRKHKPKNAPTKWIQFNDVAYSIKSNNTYKVQPNYFFTNPIPWKVGKDNKTPVMDKLITEWVGKESLQTAYEIIAYCCLTDYPIHLIFCFVGCGRNGKSKFLGLINKFVGMENVCSTELDVLLDSRFESFKLYKKLVCTLGETNFGVINKTSLLKKLTGQDLIGFEFKNKKPFDDYNYAKIVISSNSLPTSDDTSEGFYRRWLILDFPNIFPEGKDILKIIPEKEYENLAKKVTEILPGLVNKGSFTNQGTIKEREERYVMASNPLPSFIDNFCNKNSYSFVRYSEFYSAYVLFLKNSKKRRISKGEFTKVLDREAYEIRRTSKKVGEEWHNDRWIEGLELRDSCDFRDSNSTYLSPHEKVSEKKVTKVTKVTKNEEQIQDIIHQKCHICSSEPSHYWNNSKPTCKNCYKSMGK